jgi:uncharacterized membrane protein
MTTVKSLEKEVDSLKRQNSFIKKRLLALEEGGVYEEEISKKDVSSNDKESNTGKGNTSVFGILLIIFGVLLCLTGIGIIIGLPMIIWGVVLNSKTSKSTDDKKGTKKKVDTVKQEVRNKSSSHEKLSREKVKKISGSFEEDVGMKWFARIGILALVIGVGFFIKYAMDMNWINYLMRILLGVLLGIVLIIIGEIASKKKKYINWGKTLVGGGFAIVYFVIYAAYNFQEYQKAIGISQTLDIILLSMVVICAVFFSVKDNSRIIAGEAFFLGYVTSLLSNNFGFLTLVYGLLLTIGLVSVVSYKKWAVIGIGGVVASYLMYVIWSLDNTYSFASSTFILVSYFVAFMFESLFLMKDKKVLNQNIIITLINSILFFVLYYFLMEKYYSDYSGIFTLMFSVVYFVGYYMMKNLKEEKLAMVHLYLALFYITLAIPIGLNRDFITIVWALEALILTIVFLKTQIGALKIGSYAVGVITAVKTLWYDTMILTGLDFSNIINSTRFFSISVTIVCFYIIYKLLKDNMNKLSKEESFIPVIYSWIAAGFLVLLIFMELGEDYSVWVSIILSILAFIYLFISKIKNVEIFRQSLAISAILFLKVLFFDSHSLNAFNTSNIFLSTRFFSFIIAIIVFYTISFYLESKKKELSKPGSILSDIYLWAASGLLVLLVFLELGKDNSLWVSVILSVLALIYLFLSKVGRVAIFHQTLAISVILFLKVLLYDSYALGAFNTSNLSLSTRFFSYIIVIFVFYIISFYLESEKKKKRSGFGAILPDIYSSAGTVLAFLLIFIEMNGGWISIGWSFLALVIMMNGFIFHKKTLRIQGMIIFSLTIFKVFIYDTRNLETIYRILSYIVLGVILLLVSFFYTKYKEKLREIL